MQVWGNMTDLLTVSPEEVQSAQGIVEATFYERGGLTRIQNLYQRWPGRVLFPTVAPHSHSEAVIANTAGGMVGGDRFEQKFAIHSGADVTLTSQAAEKIYRSEQKSCRMMTDIKVGKGACLEWIPQETILFEGARLRRQTRFDLHPDAFLLAGEMTIFGRRARGERFKRGYLYDNWEVQTDDRLIWSDRMVIGATDSTTNLHEPFAFNAAAATALMVCQVPDLIALRDRARELMDENPIGAFTMVNGLVIGRFVSEDAAKLRILLSEIWVKLRVEIGLERAGLPRVWNL